MQLGNDISETVKSILRNDIIPYAEAYLSRLVKGMLTNANLYQLYYADETICHSSTTLLHSLAELQIYYSLPCSEEACRYSPATKVMQANSCIWRWDSGVSGICKLARI